MAFDWSAAANIGSSYLGAKSASSAAKKQAGASKYAAILERMSREEELKEGGRQFDASLGFGREKFGAQFGAQQDRQAALQKAYYDSMAKGGEVAQSGESGLLSSLAKPSESLEAQKQDILSGQSEAMQNTSSQIQANLAQQGVRGGQAATQLNRGVGAVGESALSDISKLQYGDEAKRDAMKRSYLQSKAGLGTKAQFQPTNF